MTETNPEEIKPEQPKQKEEKVSQKEFPCEKCGANLKFAPGKDAIKCEYCGHEQKVVVQSDATVDEHDYEEAIKNLKTVDSKSIISEGKEISCSGCGAVSLVAEQSVRCPFCGSPIVVDVKQSAQRIIPESVLPFKIDKKTAQKSFVDWITSRWFAPNDLSRRAQKEGMDGIYLPYWTYDSDTTTSYVGQRGEHYYTTETYTDSNGKTQTRQVQHTRWYPASGTVYVNFDDVLVCASQSLPHDLVDELEPWDLNELKPYSSQFLSGFVTERYKIDLKSGLGIAKEKMDPEIVSKIYSDIGGDEQRIISKNVRYSNITFKHILLPLWVSSFHYKEKVYRFIINARTGEATGERPYSWIKITLAIIGGAVAAYFAYVLMNGM